MWRREKKAAESRESLEIVGVSVVASSAQTVPPRRYTERSLENAHRLILWTRWSWSESDTTSNFSNSPIPRSTRAPDVHGSFALNLHDEDGRYLGVATFSLTRWTPRMPEPSMPPDAGRHGSASKAGRLKSTSTSGRASPRTSSGKRSKSQKKRDS